MNIDVRVPFSPLLHLLLPEVSLALLIALNLPFPVKAVCSCVILGYIICIILCTTTGNPVDGYALGSAVLGNTLFNIILFTWFTEPMNDFRYLSDTDTSALASRPLWSRIYNSFCITRNNRLIGWNVQVRPRSHIATALTVMLIAISRRLPTSRRHSKLAHSFSGNASHSSSGALSSPTSPNPSSTPTITYTPSHLPPPACRAMRSAPGAYLYGSL